MMRKEIFYSVRMPEAHEYESFLDMLRYTGARITDIADGSVYLRSWPVAEARWNSFGFTLTHFA